MRLLLWGRRNGSPAIYTAVLQCTCEKMEYVWKYSKHSILSTVAEYGHSDSSLGNLDTAKWESCHGLGSLIGRSASGLALSCNFRFKVSGFHMARNNCSSPTIRLNTRQDTVHWDDVPASTQETFHKELHDVSRTLGLPTLGWSQRERE